MLTQASIVSLLNQRLSEKRFLEKRETILHQHSLSGFVDPTTLAFKQQFYRTSLQLEILKDLSSRFSPEKFIVLKGMSFPAYEIYQTMGDRFTADIDLLVEDLTECSRVLDEMNFSMINNHQWKGNDFKRVFSKMAGGIEIVIELHTRLFYHSQFTAFKTLSSAYHFRVLAPEELYVHLVGHLAFQHTFLKLHWLIDIILLKQKVLLNRERVDFLLRELQLQRSEKLVDEFSHLLLGERAESFLINLDFLFEPDQHKLQYYLIKQLTKDSWLTSMDYNLHWFLQRGWKK